jgi:NADH-quinone oxidoreductase subunit C
MPTLDTLTAHLQEKFADKLISLKVAAGEITIEVSPQELLDILLILHKESTFRFEQLVDISGVDYLDYGLSEWATRDATGTGFERGVDTSKKIRVIPWDKPRFAVVYHLLSLKHNQRLRVRTFPEGDPPLINSVLDIWPSANWYEREVFDLFGIVFEGHPDLRRILTDYGFIGHPFRKDFPLSGNVEVRYDATQKRVIYEPVNIDKRVLEPKVIRLEVNKN